MDMSGTPKFWVAINRLLPHEKLGPQGADRRWASFNDSFQNEYLNAWGLFEEVMRGNAFCAELGGCRLVECGHWCRRNGCNKCGSDHCGRPHGYRLNRHFAGVQTLELDFDTGDERSTPKYWQTDPIVARHAAFAYETLSSTFKNPRWRPVFVVDEPIDDPSYARRARLALISQFPWSDHSINDPSRFFFGAKRNGDSIFMGNVLPVAVVDELIKDRQTQLHDEQGRREPPRVPSSHVIGCTPAERYVKAAIHQEAAWLASRVEGTGERHIGLLLAALKLASLAQCDWLPAEVRSKIDPVAALLPAAQQNGYSPKCGEGAARRTIADGVAYSKPRPRPGSWDSRGAPIVWSGGNWVRSVAV